ncbi:hypothetical protein [Marinobacter sp. LN3S78]|uniref:hypothetical protein n=1 Tax=Marinobacter sp. LN3S78 TaxID=3382300 RepID=UPI00387B8AF9
MKRLNKVGEHVALYVRIRREAGSQVSGFWFFNGKELVATSDRLGPACMVAPGTVVVSISGRQWVAVGGDRVNGAAGWSFTSPYKDESEVEGDAVHFNDNPRSLKIRAKLDDYLDYYRSVKGTLPDTVALRREQLSSCGAMPGQVYKGVRLEVYI